jgi:hypothetical protein
MSTLPPIDAALLPADIRRAPAAVQQRYQAGLAFEQQLTAQLCKQLEQTTGADDGSNPYSSLMPDALANAIQAGGGLGLARELAGLGPQGALR